MTCSPNHWHERLLNILKFDIKSYEYGMKSAYGLACKYKSAGWEVEDVGALTESLRDLVHQKYRILYLKASGESPTPEAQSTTVQRWFSNKIATWKIYFFCFVT